MSKTVRTTRWHRGMTLLEVIAAMTLLAIGITAALAAVSACVRSTDSATAYSRGTLLAQQVAAELERSETLEPGEMHGTFADQSAGYTWQAEVSAADDNGLYPVQIKVSWDEGKRQFELNTLLRPHALPSAQPAETPSGMTPADETPETPSTPSIPSTPTPPATPSAAAARRPR